MVNMHISYDGQLRCTATHEPSGARINTDAPRDNHGRGEAFSPTDLVGAALASCMLTTMAIVAERKGIDLRGTTVTVGKEMATDPFRRISRLPVSFSSPFRPTEEQRQLLENTAHSCPVHRALDGKVEMPVVFKWGD